MKIGVIGAGAWGTALSNLLAGKGLTVDLWAFEKEVCRDIIEERENKLFLPGINLSANIRPSNNLDKVAADKDLLLIVVPSHVFRSVATRLVQHPTERTIIVSATKGIENKTHLRMSGILHQLLPPRLHDQVAVLSGPSFAREVAQKMPTAVTVAARNMQLARTVQMTFATGYFRVYTSYDLVGVELGGALKNVIAVAAGISDGLGLGYNTRAALITRGATEIQRLGIRLGANPKTFMGLSGIGDLVLTCTGPLSRNWTVGNKLGQGMKLEEILAGMRSVAEGVRTTKSVYNMARKIGVEMPITEKVYSILYEGLDPREALGMLMNRNLKHELDDE
ncbi:MAG: NAD(P)H-dependent glycerol-3-phosphate dehydrogenase [Deltaproteobacteria bacterium]|nr:NAD(P)H-dependent glycerol-3-phosphate dehydrogenase [Deltaproteobacteria bacterium]RLB87534.1 MAG: NAD(P)H-dependent glycerol-3-phosphate dehydrogenase [Deltaproteobacteria bacterium]RLB96400.1 MAG: NAD(P)H-dependent glycerol-3-phosphate dehydrogenase [Deltaproteobacteria bacterium]RLC09700.1 MAG: NAD(P)H-dependent glycerol-3-phosphate dehydrogenase [Deltaproteobacteria bacterium]